MSANGAKPAMNVLVVGGGIMGLSIAWGLVRDGHRVTVFEQGPVPNPLGSSVDQHRMIRYFYPDEPGYCRMVDQAYVAWRTLWSDLGATHHSETGTLAVSTRDGDWADRSRATLSDLGREFRILQPDELARAYPFVSVADANWAIHCRSGGILFAAPIVAALADHLRARGVDLRCHCPVAGVDPANARITLADGNSVMGDALVVAAGPWVGRLLPDMEARTTIKRQVVVYLAPPKALVPAWSRAPALVDLGGPEGAYVFPPTAGTDLKVGVSAFAAPGAPDERREVEPGEADAVLAHFAERIGNLADYRVKDARSCCYTMSADDRFIVEAVERAWVVTGFSGHGFKFAAVLGLEVAAAVAGARDPGDLANWSAGR